MNMATKPHGFEDVRPPWILRKWFKKPALLKAWQMTYTSETELRYYAQAYYTPVALAKSMACLVTEDLIETQENPDEWVYWDPAAGSGRLYEQLPKDCRYASDILSFDFQHKMDGRFFPSVDFLKHTVPEMQQTGRPIYVVANPPYGQNLPYQFINRAFEGVYAVKRGMFLVSSTFCVERIRTNNCVLIKESPTFKADFDLIRERRTGTKVDKDARALRQCVKLILLYSHDEVKKLKLDTCGAPSVPRQSL
jgi:hypothetical protein